jgi:hypothetical protein
VTKDIASNDIVRSAGGPSCCDFHAQQLFVAAPAMQGIGTDYRVDFSPHLLPRADAVQHDLMEMSN